MVSVVSGAKPWASPPGPGGPGLSTPTVFLSGLCSEQPLTMEPQPKAAMTSFLGLGLTGEVRPLEAQAGGLTYHLHPEKR